MLVYYIIFFFNLDMGRLNGVSIETYIRGASETVSSFDMSNHHQQGALIATNELLISNTSIYAQKLPIIVTTVLFSLVGRVHKGKLKKQEEERRLNYQKNHKKKMPQKRLEDV